MPRETVKSSLRLSVSDEPLFAEKAAGKVLRRGKFSASLAFIRSLAGVVLNAAIITLAPFYP